jgi:hypothetical protein
MGSTCDQYGSNIEIPSYNVSHHARWQQLLHHATLLVHCTLTPTDPVHHALVRHVIRAVTMHMHAAQLRQKCTQQWW